MRSFRRPVRSLLLLAGTILITACAGCQTGPVATDDLKPAPEVISGWPRTITDDSGSALTLSTPPRRIVSLAPSNTEVLYALGAGDLVVADTESCDYPPEAKNRPHIGGMTAGDLERIQVQLPDLVIGVGSINKKLITALRASHIPTLVVEPRTTSDVYASIRLIGKAIGKDGEAERLALELKGRMDRLRGITAQAKFRPKTLIVYSDNPIYTSPPNSFIHDISAVAGGEDIVREPLPQDIISPAVVLERAPDVILCSPRLNERLRRLPGWEIVPAVKNNRFFSATANAELTRPGPRLAPAAEQLARYLHPELFPTPGGRGAP